MWNANGHWEKTISNRCDLIHSLHWILPIPSYFISHLHWWVTVWIMVGVLLPHNPKHKREVSSKRPVAKYYSSWMQHKGSSCIRGWPAKQRQEAAAERLWPHSWWTGLDGLLLQNPLIPVLYKWNSKTNLLYFFVFLQKNNQLRKKIHLKLEHSLDNYFFFIILRAPSDTQIQPTTSVIFSKCTCTLDFMPK